MKIWLFIQNTFIPLEETNSQRGAAGSLPSPGYSRSLEGTGWGGLERGDRQLGRISHLPDALLPDQI